MSENFRSKSEKTWFFFLKPKFSFLKMSFCIIENLQLKSSEMEIFLNYAIF